MEDKKPVLKILREPFVKWFFQSKDDFRGYSDDMYNTLMSGDKFEVILEGIWDTLGYIEMRMIANPEAVILEDITKDNEIEAVSNYDVEFISENDV